MASEKSTPISGRKSPPRQPAERRQPSEERQPSDERQPSAQRQLGEERQPSAQRQPGNERQPSDERQPGERSAGHAEGTIQLVLLGGFRLLHDGKPVVVPRGLQRAIALIGLRPGATRSHLAGLLWPDTPEERALSSLRTALWRLRQDPFCPIVTAGDTVRLHPRVNVDVDELVRAASEVNQGGDPRPAAPVLAAGRHDLLPGWYDDWVLLERERLRQLRLHLLDETARAHLRAGDHGAALQAALEAIAAEPLRETPHRLVVATHLAEGNAYEALHAFYVYRDLLLRELQLEPSTAMHELINQVLPPIISSGQRRGRPGTDPPRVTRPARERPA